MVAKYVCLLVVVVAFVCLQDAQSAPRIKSLADISNVDLADKFSEFLEQDGEAQALLDWYRSEGDHVLSKRQTKSTEMSLEDSTAGGDPGFLDRAAKFVLELVQRFLKWINTD